MTYRYNLKCDVCSEIFIIKIQAGFVDKYVFNVGCPHCKSLVKGSVQQDPPWLNLEIKNATDLTESFEGREMDLHITSVSTEFPIIKGVGNIKSRGGLSESTFMSMFGSNLMTPLDYVSFSKNYIDFKKFRDEYISVLATIIELFKNSKWDLVNKQIKNKFIPNLPDDTPNSMETCTILLSQVIKLFTNKIIPANYIDKYSTSLLQDNTINKINNKDILCEIYNEVGTLVNIQQEYTLSLNIILSFIENIESYLPALAICYGKGFEYISQNNLHISTFSFDELKDKYKDTFELASRVSLIYLAFTNFNRNNSINSMSDISSDCKNLKIFFGKANGDKIPILNQIPILKNYYRDLLDNKIRNSIGHYRTQYFTLEQIIKYYPQRSLNKKDAHEEISLFDFAYKTLQLHLLIIDFIDFIAKWNKEKQ